MATTVEMLANQLQAQVRGDRTLIIHDAQAVQKAGPHDVTFVGDESTTARELEKCSAGAVFVSKTLNASLADEPVPPALIVVDDARMAFMQVLDQFRPKRPRPLIGISPNAYVGTAAQFGENTNVFAGAHICEDVVIGENCDIHPGVYVGPGCRLGDEVTLHPNVVLYPDTVIGDRVVIHASAVVGADGFGYTFEADGTDGLGRYVKVPQLGTVQIHDDVEIGAGTTIDRGTIGPTVIGEGTKIDNQVMIAHNCEVGRHNGYASQVGFAGSVTTGDYVRCAGQVGIADHIHLGDGCTVEAKSGIHRDVPAGETVFGIPARPMTEQARIAAITVKLPEMRKRIRTLEAQINELTARSASDNLSETQE